MVAGTQITKITYLPLISILYIALKPEDQLLIFNYMVKILAVILLIGIISYFLSKIGINPKIGYVNAPNIAKFPYLVYFGHVEETNLPIYRFSSVFDEAGLVGTLCGLLLSSIGFSIKNKSSIILLVAGLIPYF